MTVCHFIMGSLNLEGLNYRTYAVGVFCLPLDKLGTGGSPSTPLGNRGTFFLLVCGFSARSAEKPHTNGRTLSDGFAIRSGERGSLA